MTYTPERTAAYDALDAAVNQCVEAFDAFGKGGIPVGYVVLVAGAIPVTEDDEDYSPDDDDQEMRSLYTFFPKRGQMPVVTRGLVENYRDRFARGE